MTLSGLLLLPSDMTFVGQNVSPVSLALSNSFCLSFPWLLSILRRLREGHGLKDLCSRHYSYLDGQVVARTQDMESVVQAQLCVQLSASCYQSGKQVSVYLAICATAL